MKITIFSDNVAPYRLAWAEELAKSAEVSFVYTKSKDAMLNDSWLMDKSDSVKMVKIPAKIIRNQAITLNVIKYIKKNDCGIIVFDGYGIIPNYLAILYMKLKKKEHYINVDGVYIHKKESTVKKLMKKLILSKKYARFLCGSEYAKNYYVKSGFSSDRITVHNFTSVFEKDIIDKLLTCEEKGSLRRELNLEERPAVLGVGRFLDWKRFDLLIRAFAPFDSKYQLLIVGEGAEKETYQNLIKELNLSHVRLIDFMNYEKLKKYYKASDLFVLPSVTEIWGLVVNEAMSFGLPVITSDDCIAGEALIENGKNGYIFSKGEEELGKYISEIMENCDLRKNMSENNLRKIRDYTIEHIGKVHIEEFNRFLKN